MLEVLGLSERQSASHIANWSFSKRYFLHIFCNLCISFFTLFRCHFFLFLQPSSLISLLRFPILSVSLGTVKDISHGICHCYNNNNTQLLLSFLWAALLYLLSYQVRICHDSQFKREVIIHWSHYITLVANGGRRASRGCVYSSSSHIKCQHFTASVSGDWTVVLHLLTYPSCFCSASHCSSKEE